MNILFCKSSFQLPIREGATLHAGHMMRELVKLGHDVTLLTSVDLANDAKDWLIGVKTLNVTATIKFARTCHRSLSRFSQYWGITEEGIAGVIETVKQLEPEIVVAVGPEMLCYLAEIKNCKRVWYAADSLLLHEYSRLGFPNVRNLLTFAIYESCLKKSTDLTWVVSEKDRRWSRYAGGGKVTVVPNGVDSKYYVPQPGIETTPSCVFWGNLGFGPNRDAINLFLTKIWPGVMKLIPKAEFNLCGVNPAPELIREIQKVKGVHFYENVQDLRPIINQSRVAVFPFVSGGGVKNKLLEAASMGKMIIASNRCRMGLEGEKLPIEFVDKPRDWIKAISKQLANVVNTSATSDIRDWVLKHHQWDLSAKRAEQQLQHLINSDTSCGY